MNKPTWRVLTAEGADREDWLRLLARWPEREVFAHPGYLDLYRSPHQYPLCLVLEVAGGTVIHPVMAREVPASDGRLPAVDLAAPPFGYGGPFLVGWGSPLDRVTLVEQFYAHFARWAGETGVIAEYSLFSPLSEPPEGYPGRVVERMQTVVRTLEMTEDELWGSYKKTIRNKVRQARSKGVTVTVDPTGENAAGHLRVHHAVMEFRNGMVSHVLDEDFVTRMIAAIPGQFVYVHGWLDGELIGSTLYLLSSRSALAFRGGVHPEHYGSQCEPLITHEAMVWAMRNGRTAFVLGGGVSADDSILQHKRMYAQDGVRSLWAGYWSIDKERYQRLVEQRLQTERARGREWEPPDNYFPAYRAPVS